MLPILQTVFQSTLKRTIFFIVLAISIFFISKDFGMFWDNVLFASKLGNVLYENSIFNWNIPIEFDPGHPPFLGFLLAIIWKILGHKLWVGHFLILFFNIGFFYQLYQFVRYFITNKNYQIFAFLLVIIDPSLSASFVLVNPEIIILFFFLLIANSIFYKNRFLKFLGIFFLSIVSYRSMMLLSGIFLFDVVNKYLIQKEKMNFKNSFQFLCFYFFASLPGVTFVLWRLIYKGWLQTHPNSPWSGLWQFADIKIFLKNCVVLAHRYLDFGRIFLFVFLIVSFFMIGKKTIESLKNKQLLLLAVTSVLFVIIVSLLATNTMGHRYFIISFICFNLLSFRILFTFFQKQKKVIYILLFTGLITGNLWVYPKHISQGWDATLAHTPYHSLRLKAIDYLDENNIPLEKVASFFPNYNTLDLIDFSGDLRAFIRFEGNNQYVFYSNVYNLSDEEIKTLHNNYTILKEFNNFNINITIYILKDS